MGGYGFIPASRMEIDFYSNQYPHDWRPFFLYVVPLVLLKITSRQLKFLVGFCCSFLRLLRYLMYRSDPCELTPTHTWHTLFTVYLTYPFAAATDHFAAFHQPSLDPQRPPVDFPRGKMIIITPSSLLFWAWCFLTGSVNAKYQSSTYSAVPSHYNYVSDSGRTEMLLWLCYICILRTTIISTAGFLTPQSNTLQGNVYLGHLLLGGMTTTVIKRNSYSTRAIYRCEDPVCDWDAERRRLHDHLQTLYPAVYNIIKWN